MEQLPLSAGEKQALPPVVPGASPPQSGSESAGAGPRHDQAVTAASPATFRPESGEGPKRRLRSDHSGPPIRASGRRITQQKVDPMVDLRRQGFTYKDIGARLGCSERTVRRYVGHVPKEVEVPRDESEPDADLDQIRAWLLQWFTSLLADEFDLGQSLTLIDEAHYRLERRLARTHPNTLRLLAQNQPMRFRFYYEVVGPLCYDLARSDPSGLVGTEQAEPSFWRPPFDDLGTLLWRPGPEVDGDANSDGIDGIGTDPSRPGLL